MTMISRMTLLIVHKFHNNILTKYNFSPFCILETLLLWESWDCWLLSRVQLYCFPRESDGELVSAPSPWTLSTFTMTVFHQVEPRYKVLSKGYWWRTVKPIYLSIVMSVISDGCQNFERVIFQIVEGGSIFCTIIFQQCVPSRKDNVTILLLK